MVSVCNSEFGDIKELKTYIYEKYENRLLGNSPYKKVKDYINKPK